MPFGESRQKVRENIHQYLPVRNIVDAAALDVANSSGRMYRPLMLMSVAQGYGVSLEKSSIAASALEMGHAASLILDDMADKSETRRGRPSCWASYGSEVATMAAVRLIFGAQIVAARSHDDPAICLDVVKIMNDGAIRTLEGQVADVSCDRELSQNEIEQIAERKTGVLFDVAGSIGEVLANRKIPSQYTGLWSPLGRKVGLCYQIGDDIHDFEDSEEKVNLARKIGVDSARSRQKELLDSVNSTINSLERDYFDSQPIRNLLEEMFPELH